MGSSKSKKSKQSKDEMVIDMLKEHGSDLTKPHDIDFFFYMPSEEAAESCAGILKQNDYKCEVKFNEEYEVWTINAIKAFVPSLETMEELTEVFEELAEDYDGEYDGWGTNIVE